MPHIRFIAAAAAAVVLALSLQPALAQSSDDANGKRGAAAQPASGPMKLDNFMTTWKPVSASRRAKTSRSKSARKSQSAARQSAAKAAAAETASRQTAGAPAQTPEKAIETDGVAVTSFNEVNELDTAANTVAASQIQANQVQVVAFNEVNEIDLAAPLAPAPATAAAPLPQQAYAETTGQAVASEQPAPADNSWIGKLLLAAGGTIALAGAARFFLAA